MSSQLRRERVARRLFGDFSLILPYLEIDVAQAKLLDALMDYPRTGKAISPSLEPLLDRFFRLAGVRLINEEGSSHDGKTIICSRVAGSPLTMGGGDGTSLPKTALTKQALLASPSRLARQLTAYADQLMEEALRA